MKKITRDEFFVAVLLIVLTIFIASCDFSEFAIPESVTITGSPEVHIPLGSPFVEKNGKNKNIIEEYLSVNKILEMMGGADEEASALNNINIYEYAPPSKYEDVKAFIIHYPIAKMPYDLGEYMQQVYDIKPPKIEGVDLRRPAEVENLFPGKTLSELTALTEMEIEDAVDKKIDEWVDDTAAGKPVNVDIPAAQAPLSVLSAALNNPLLTSDEKTQLIVSTKAEVKALQEVVDAKATAVSQFNTLKSRVEELRQKMEIPLGDMAKLVKYIDVKDTGVKIKGMDFEGKIEIAIPQFGVGSGDVGSGVTYAPGEVKNGDLHFTTDTALAAADGNGDSETYRFEIDDNAPNLTVHINIKDFIEGPIVFEPELVFNWTEAKVDPGENGKLTGSYDMDFENIKNFLGEGDFELPEVLGYLYVMDLPISKNSNSKPTVSLKVGSDDDGWIPLTKDDNDQLVECNMENKDIPEEFSEMENGETLTKDLPPASLDSIDMTDVFMAPSGSSLEYTVTMGDAKNPLTLTNTVDDLSGVISVDMVVVIPLAFNIKATPMEVDGKRFIPLELNGENGESLLPKIEEDLFGRDGKGSTIDEVIGPRSNITIKLEKFVNKALPNAVIWIKAGTSEQLLELSGDGVHDLSFEGDDVKYPFTPEFKILIPCEMGEDYGTLSVGKAYDFDFNLVVEIKADLNKTIDF
ncbi:MAG: hypothetical protein LBE74_07535 [Treponema sp.]|jgi:hypothetical protein|nr:hypothetical protein [Treponema sp.]